MIHYLYTIFIILLLASCRLPFKTNSSMGDIFEIFIEHDILRITDSALIHLTWEPMSVENFSHFRIERRVALDTNWTFIKDIKNPILTKYRDYIYDDENLHYRVGIMDLDLNVLWSKDSVIIPKTTTLFVPDESTSPFTAFGSPLIDNNDTIVVKSGFYDDGLSMIGKTVYVKSSIDNNAVGFSSRVIINSGILDGFTIQDHQALQNGGGLYISGNGEVKNCLIINNESGRNGGGVYIREEGSLYNCILFNNQSLYGSANLYVEKSSGEIINNTFVLVGDIPNGNNVTVSEIEEGFLFLNNIIFGGQNFVTDSSGIQLTIVDYSRLDQTSACGDSTISDNPNFVNAESGDFQLMPYSPCINSGHPDLKYNNRDGSRNSMGAYGGPEALD